MRRITRYTLPIVLSVMNILTTGCDEKKNDPVYPDVMEVVASTDNMFDGEGGRLKILVNSNVDYDIDIDVDWISHVNSRSEQPSNGCIIFNVGRYDIAATDDPREGNITISAEGIATEKIKVTQTPSDIYRFEIMKMSANTVSSEGGIIEVEVSTNIDVRTSVSDPGWIAVEKDDEGKYLVTVSENTETAPREGHVVFSTDELGEFKAEFTQEPHVEKGGISTPDQMMAFAAAVNTGADLTDWCDASGEVVLLEDIDMSGHTWEPIGDITGATISNTVHNITAGNPFKGIFNGNGHTIRNLSIETDRGPCFGLFGACENATIKNLTIDRSCTLKIDNEALKSGSVYGFIVGMAINSTLENITVDGQVLPSVLYKEKTNYINCVAGIAGYIVSSTVRSCVFSGIFGTVRSNVYHSSLCSNVSGIVGYAFGSKGAEVKIEDCVNRGYVYGRTNRVGGIMAGSNGSYILENCKNEGFVHGSVAEAIGCGWSGGIRVGGIMTFALCKPADGTKCEIINCENSGTVIGEGDASTIVGGILGNPRCHHLVSATSCGTVISTGGAMTGVITGQYAYSDKPVVETAACGGRIAYGFTGEGLSIVPVDPITITADNYFEYAVGGFTGTADGSWVKDKISFVAR